MNLDDLTPSVTVKSLESQYSRQFSKKVNFSKLTVSESKTSLKKTQALIGKFKQTANVHMCESNPTYLKLKMLEEAASLRLAELATDYGNQHSVVLNKMNKNYVTALKKVAMGGSLTEAQIKKIKAPARFKKILESKNRSINLVKRLVEAKRAGKGQLFEGEIDAAQTVLAAQDIADQVQTMIEKLADVQYKDLPALHDSIRNNQGTDAAQSFNSSVLDSLQTLTQSLEAAKQDLNGAVGVLTGDEPMGADDLDMDGLGDEEGMGDMDMDMDMEEPGMDDVDLGDEFDMDFDSPEGDMDDMGAEDPADELSGLGRERR